MTKTGTSVIARALRGEGSSGKPSLARGFRLGPWQVRPEQCLLESAEGRAQLEPKIMGVLLCLAEQAPKVVTREQFIASVWDGRLVSDEVLSRAVSLLRSELGDNTQEPRYIRTVPRVGYALVATVEPLARAEPIAEAAPRSRRLTWLAGVGLAIAATLVALWLTRRNDVPSPEPVRLAVLPLASDGLQAADAGLADGLTEDLTVSLARVPGIRVVARNSALRFRSRDAELAEAAEALGATHLLTGSVRAAGQRLRITLHLADAATGTEAWAASYDRSFGDLFGVQADISAAVAEALERRLPAGAAATGYREPPPANPEAYRLYLQGRRQLARRGEEGLREAKALLERSVATDPGFLRAHMALAWACTLLGQASPAASASSVECADRGLAAVARETAMSDEVHAVKAWLALERNRWIDAEAAFRTGLAATPDDTEMRLLHSQMLGALGQSEAAQSEADLALANDPLSPAVMLRYAVLALWRDDEARAAGWLAKARELDLAPSAAPEVPMMLAVRAGQFDALERSLRDLQRRRGQSDAWVAATVAAVRDPAQGKAAEEALQRAVAAGQIDGLLHFGALILAGRHERALQWLLERPRLRTRELEFALRSREAAGLRRLPEFSRAVVKFGLDGYWDRHGWPEACNRAAGVIRCR